MSRPTNKTGRQRFRQAVGGRIRTMRERNGWSQEVLADRAGLDRTFLGKVERGASGMSYDRLPDIAAALEVEPYALIPGWEAFSGEEPRDTWTVPLGLAMPEAVLREHNLRRLDELLEDSQQRNGPVPDDVAAAVDTEWREALSREPTP